MFYKYLKLVLFSTLLLQASPKAFNSLGNELESFKKDCKIYLNMSSLPTKIKKQCKIFNSKINSAFKVGYELDLYVEKNNINEKKLNKYLDLLRNLDKNKENILHLIYREAQQARKQNNIEYYSQLIVNDKIKLYPSDYQYMEENKDIFAQNKRYISHMNYLKSLEESRKPISVTKKQEVRNHQIVPKSSKFSGLDVAAYKAYERTEVFQIRNKMAKTNPYTDMSAVNHQSTSIVDWNVTLKSLKEQTNTWAILAAIAKGYHTDFIYVILSLSLRDENNNEVYRTPKFKKKMYMDRRNYVHQSSAYPEGLVFSSAVVMFDIDLDGLSYTNQLKKVRRSNVSTVYKQNNSLLNNVDLISSSAFLRDDVLTVSFFYKNRSIDKQLYWKNDVVTISCKAYGNAGDWLKSMRGSLIGQISNKRVTRAFQNIYIDIRKTVYKSGILECSLNVHGRIFKIHNTFLIN